MRNKKLKHLIFVINLISNYGQGGESSGRKEIKRARDLDPGKIDQGHFLRTESLPMWNAFECDVPAQGLLMAITLTTTYTSLCL